MATKREKEPVQPDQSVQSPEAQPQVPNPESRQLELAATIQPNPTPRTGTTSTPSAATPLIKPTLRSIGGAFDPTLPAKVRQDQLDEVIVFTPPAAARLSALATRLLGECAIANGLGTQEPVKAFLGYSEDRTQYSIMPVGPKATKGVELNYIDGLASLTFRQVFQETSKYVEDGYREYYPVWKTDSPIELHETTGWALYFSIEQRKRERIQSREETAETPKAKTKKSTTDAKESTPGAGTAKTAATETPGATSTSATPDVIDEYDDPDYVIIEQQKTISELEARLKEYEQKFGKLDPKQG